MSKGAKQVIIILGLLLVVCSVFLMSTFSQKTSLEQNNSKLQEEIATNKKNLATFEQKQKELTAENNEVKKQASDVMGQKNKLENEVDKLTTKISDFESRIETLNNDRDEWKERYGKISKERDDAMAKLQKAEEALEEEKKRAAEEMAVSPSFDVDPNKKLESHWSEVLKEKAELNLRIAKLEGELNQSAMDVEELNKKNSDLELEISALKQEKEELARQIKLKRDVADSISIDLVREKNDKQFVNGQFDKLKEENLALRGQVKELGSMKIVLEKSISRLQEDKAEIERKLAQSETVIQNRLDDVLQLKEEMGKASTTTQEQEVMLPPIIVNGSSSEAKVDQAGVKVSGEIVSVNQENNFVIVSLGEKSGIGIGDRLSVYRGDAYVGEIEIIQVRTDISAADIKKQSMPLQPGDIIK
jgi:septal ring factor EnvC (AmiA/AmiB activator)